MSNILPAPDALAKQTTLCECPHGADALVLSHYTKQHAIPWLHIARDDKQLERLKHGLQFFAPQLQIIAIPAWDCLPYDRVSPSHTILSQRINALSELASLKRYQTPESRTPNPIILTTVNALLQRVPPLDTVNACSFTAKPGDTLDREQLISYLIKAGYNRSATANEAGDFAVRGSIVDIIPSGFDDGMRLDFFGDTLEQIRSFDPLSQISGNRLKQFKLVPASEIILDTESIERFRNQYRMAFGAVTSEDPLYDAVSEGRKYAGMEHWQPLFYSTLDTLFDYVPENCIVSLDHLCIEARDERIAMIEDYYQARIKAKEMDVDIANSFNPLEPRALYLTANEWQEHIKRYSIFSLTPFSAPDDAETVIAMGYKNAPVFDADAKVQKTNSFDLLLNYIKACNKPIAVACISQGSRDRLCNMLAEHDIINTKINTWTDIFRLKSGVTGVVVLDIEQGIECDAFLLVSEQDILGERLSRTQRTRKRSEKFLIEAGSLSEGELVVHNEHGIGRFESLETLNVQGENHDCLRIVYDGGDKLFIPVENIETLKRYGADNENTKLDKLGGASWQARKAAMKKRIKVIAEDLMKVAAERALNKAPVLHGPEGVYEEFCARFPYNETDDQLRAIDEVQADLSSGKPMDRLICGDVGFGKTEVALRAAFLAANSHDKQVAVIAPTTLLARQHYKVFKERFAGLPFEIRHLSRLVPSADTKKTKEMLKEGKADIVIGTHALLAKSSEYKNLSLVVIDEEQQFGVAQKERLKQLRSDVHVLSLSATPIPRTLQMSLSGIKELSLIATPPVDRLAVRSFIMPFDPVVIRNAILREHYRGGSTFYVAPRIKDLDDIKKQLDKLVPEIKYVIAHGKMTPAALDETMNAFYDGKYDVLISTNIIGSGIDLPTANTIIIHRSDMFGLGQLYQLRGRVGRSKLRAYAYFTIAERRVPTKTALRRLEVMQNLDALGAGFSLASHDMDIRGFGNLLGDEQSGQVKEVGVELYQEMLRDAIEATKTAKIDTLIEDEHFSPSINLGISVLIPDAYVSDLDLRLGLYKRIGGLETEDEIEQMAAELIDRFGPLPVEVENLLHIMKIKHLCRQAGIEKVDTGPKGMVLSFFNNKFKKPEKLIDYIAKNPVRIKLRGDQKLILFHEWKTPEDKLAGTKASLEEIVGLAA